MYTPCRVSPSHHTYDSVPRGRREEGVPVGDEEEVRLALGEGVGEVVWLWVHDVVRQAERMRYDVQVDVVPLGDVVLLEGKPDV